MVRILLSVTDNAGIIKDRNKLFVKIVVNIQYMKICTLFPSVPPAPLSMIVVCSTHNYITCSCYGFLPECMESHDSVFQKYKL